MSADAASGELPPPVPTATVIVVRDSPELHDAARELAARAVDMARVLLDSAIEDRKLERGGRKAFAPHKLEGLHDPNG